MSTTDGYRETNGIAALGPADLDMATLEDVTSAARLYAQAADRLAGAYTEYMHAVRTLAAAQQAVHEAAHALTSAEQMMQEGGRPSHPTQQPAPPAEPREAAIYAPPREPEPEMTSEVESAHDYAPPSDEVSVNAGAVDGATPTPVEEGTAAATPRATTAGAGAGGGEPAAERAAPSNSEGGLKVIPRFLGNPPPRISQP